MVCPERSSRAARQTTSGRSPGCDTNSKSCSQISEKGSSLAVSVTCRPSQEQRMLCAVEKETLVTEAQSKDFGRLQVWPLRLAVAFRGSRKHLVAPVLLITVQSHPFVHA